MVKNKLAKYPLIFIMGAGTASGKDMVTNFLKKKVKFIISSSQVTRPKRKGETNGIYKFISQEKFNRLLEEDKLLEYHKHFDHYYGTLKSTITKNINKNIVMKQIDIVGMNNLKTDPKFYYNKKNHTILINNNIIKVYFIGIKRKSLLNNILSYIKRNSFDITFFDRLLRSIKERNYVIKNCDFVILNPENHPEIAANDLHKILKGLN